MNVAALADADVPGMLLETVAEAVSATVLLYDRQDEIVYASAPDPTLVPISREFLAAGTRLRDLLEALYDAGGREFPGDGRSIRPLSRDDWIANKISSLWKERSEFVEKRGDRWVRYQKRRLASGYGVCIVQDISEQMKREQQLLADIQRMQVTETVLDNLPLAVCINTQDMVYTGVNQAFARFAAMPAEHILGRTPADVLPPDVAQRLESLTRQIIKTGIAVAVPERLTTADGTVVNAMVRKFRIGRPGRYHVVTTIESVQSDDTGTPPVSQSEIQERQPDVTYDIAIQSIAGRKVLVVSAVRALADAAMKALAALGAETATVVDARELHLFLAAARDAAVDVHAVLLDSALSGSCGAVAARFQVPVVIADHHQLMNGAQAHVAAIFSRPDAIRSHGEQTRARSAIDVLVVEDNAVNQIVFSRILESFGYRFTIATTGDEAVTLWRELSPRLVLMDITLPGINGFEAARSIREIEIEEATVSPTPIIGVLPHPFERDRDDCFASGMNDVILKPISPEMLEAVFAVHMRDDVALTA